MTATQNIDLTPSELECAAEELGFLTGLSRSEVMNYAYEHAGSRDTHDVALQVGRMAHQVLSDPGSFGLTADQLGAARLALSEHSASDRRRLAQKGWALPDGSYPVETREDADSAADLIRARHGDWDAATKLLAKRCSEEGWRNPLGGSPDEFQGSAYWDDERNEAVMLTPGSMAALSAEESGLVLALSDSGDPVASEVARICMTHGGHGYVGLASPSGSPEEFGLARDGGMIGGHGQGGADEIAARNPGTFGMGGGSRTKPAGKTERHRSGRGHIRTCPKDCARDHNQPRRASAMHPEAERLIKKHAGLGMFGRPDPDPSAGNFSVAPGQPAPAARRY